MPRTEKRCSRPWSSKHRRRQICGSPNGKIPLFIDEPVLPKAFVSGASYRLPDLYADDYTTGTHTRLLAEVTVFDDETPDGRTVASGQAFTPTVTENGRPVTVQYKAGAAVITREIPAILSYEDGRLSVANYFVGTDIEAVAEETYTSVRGSERHMARTASTCALCLAPNAHS